MINNEKRDVNPKTKGKWLGAIIDTRELTFTVLQEKIAKLLKDITMYLNQEFLIPKQLLKVAGQISALQLAIGALVWLFARNMYHFIEKEFLGTNKKNNAKKLKKNLNFDVTILTFTMGIDLSLDREQVAYCSQMPMMKVTVDMF